MPRVVRVDPSKPEPEAIAEAAAVLARGGLVAFPTETVYGLGARGLHAAEVAKIFEAKGRPTGHPLILHVDGVAMARAVASSLSDVALRLADELWPGPLTLVVPRGARVPAEVSGGLPTVGLRAPAHPVALALIRAASEPLAAPSANAHMHVSPTTAEHVVRSLGERVDLVLDGGPCAHGIESTVVAVEADPPRVLRPGAVSLERLRAIVPGIVHEAVAIEGDVARASPGMASKHYAPRAPVVLVSRGTALPRALEEAFDAGSRVAERAARSMPRELGVSPSRAEPLTMKVGAIVATEAARAAASRAGCAPLVALPDAPEAYARGLFAALHEVDAAEVDLVVVEDVPDTAEWWAVRDRLTRAARR